MIRGTDNEDDDDGGKERCYFAKVIINFIAVIKLQHSVGWPRKVNLKNDMALDLTLN